MQIVKCEQKSDLWFELRSKRLTASHASAIGNCGKGLTTYINQMMQDFYALTPPERFSNSHTERGQDLEDSAAFRYSMDSGLETEKIGFVIHSDFVGVSPDLFAGSKGLCEIKCRDRKAYWEMLNTGKLQSSEIWQSNMQMLVCKKDWCDVTYYNPEYKKDLIITRLEPDQKKFDALEKGFSLGQEMIEEITAKWEGILN